MNLACLIGKEPPQVPAGGRAYVSLDRGQWSVRVDMNDGSKPKRLGPSFTSQVVAYAYLSWILGEVDTFEYPEGEA